MDRICRHYIVTGRVQGVWFRDSAKKCADELNITGWVQNMDTGAVELLACGEPETIVQLEQWLESGSMLAKVDKVISEKLPYKEHLKFEIK